MITAEEFLDIMAEIAALGLSGTQALAHDEGDRGRCIAFASAVLQKCLGRLQNDGPSVTFWQSQMQVIADDIRVHAVAQQEEIQRHMAKAAKAGEN